MDAVLALIALRGRVVLCGALAQYNSLQPAPGPKNLYNLLLQRGRMESFNVFDYVERQGEAIGAISNWLAEGKLVSRVDIQEDLENAPATLHRLFKGANEGKQLLRVAS